MTDQLEPQMAPSGPGKLAVARDFLVDTRAEMDKVSWPPREELMKATKAVLLAALFLGIIIGLADKILQTVLIGGLAALSK
jgi:preprotein translocase SecE subunit